MFAFLRQGYCPRAVESGLCALQLRSNVGRAGLMLRLLQVQLWACELPNAELMFFENMTWPVFHQCASAKPDAPAGLCPAGPDLAGAPLLCAQALPARKV